MKNNKIIFGIIVLFAITGIYGIQNVCADSWNDVEIPSSSYIYVHTKTLEYKDELILSVSSTGIINTYIMDASQFSTLQSSGGLIWEYCMRWKDMTYLQYTYIIPTDGIYYVVLYNKDIIYTRTVDFSITIDYFYEPYDPFYPDEPTENIFWDLLIFVVIPITVIVLVIAVPIIIIKKHKKKTPKEVINVQEREIPKNIYCPECGAEILDKERVFCSKCGIKIKH